MSRQRLASAANQLVFIERNAKWRAKRITGAKALDLLRYWDPTADSEPGGFR